MTGNGHLQLSQSLQLAELSLRPSPVRGLDNFNLDLPPAIGGSDTPSAAAMQALGTLYLQAELEQAGLIPAAEALVESRGSLQLPTEKLAEVLERFAQQERNWYDRASRNQLFARIFGIGAGATTDAGAAVNHEFEQLLAVLCNAINRYANDQTRLGPPPTSDEAAISQAAGSLLSNLGLRQYGNTAFAARQIQEQLQAAIGLLKDPGIQRMFNANGFWATLARILAPNAPDIARLVERGQAGQHLLVWAAGAASGPGAAALPLGPQVFQWAATWLAASGLDTDSSAVRSVA